ncbi:MAG: outer membrane beta-barrel protein [Bacteroidales bacterium]|nr:outer membrane beta-barrel protein [Bacteroidales bacterium]
MKKIGLLTLLLLLSVQIAFNQEDSSYIENQVDVDELVQVNDNGKTTVVNIGGKEVLTIRETDQGVTIDIDDNNIFKVTETDNGVTIKVGEDEILSIIQGSDTTTTINDKQLEEIIEGIGKTIEKSIEDHNKNVELNIESDKFSLHTDDVEKTLELLENDDNVSIWIEGIEVLSTDGGDTTKIRLKNKEINIVEDENGKTSVNVEKIEKDPKKKKFKGHYQGFDLGFNDFVNKDYSFTRSDADQFMDLNISRSETFGLNILQYSFGLGTNQLGVVTGLGFQFSDYFFSGNNSIRDSLGYILALDYTDVDLIKSKLSTTYLQIPLLIEAQFPNTKRSKRVHIAAGVVGDLKLGSHTKVVYRENGNRQKEKEKGDFALRPLRYGFTVRTGYKALNLFAIYYPQTFFEKGKGPELYPFSIGFTFNP